MDMKLIAALIGAGVYLLTKPAVAATIQTTQTQVNPVVIPVVHPIVISPVVINPPVVTQIIPQPVVVPVSLGVKSFHNQLHSNFTSPLITKHAAQMGYDYTTQPDSKQYGMGRIINSAITYPWIGFRDGQYRPDLGMTAAKKAEYDAAVCIKDLNQSDPALRYWINFVNPGAPCYDTATCNNGPSMVTFITNYQRQSAIDLAINYYNNAIDWANIDAVFFDQIEIDSFEVFGLGAPPAYRFGDHYDAGQAGQCAGQQDYDLLTGFKRFRKQLVDMVHSHGKLVSGNVWIYAVSAAEVEASDPIEHYYNESGQSQDVSNFGGLPPGKVSLEVVYPPRSGINLDFNTTLQIAGTAGHQGSWFGAYGEDYEWVCTLQPTGDIPTPGMNAIQLLRVMPNWDNLVGAQNRVWNGSAYMSSNSYADQNVIVSRHGKNGKIFVVFRSMNGSITLDPGESIISIMRADGIFIESGNGSGDLVVSNGIVRLGNSGMLGNGFIITTNKSGGLSGFPPYAPSGLSIL